VPYLNNYWSDSFGPKYDPSVFGVLQLLEYSVVCAIFISHAISNVQKRRSLAVATLYPSDPGDPDNNNPDNKGPDDPHNNPDGSEHGIQNNLADAIAALARNVQRQGDSPRSKVREPDPFNGTDPAKLRTFLVQLRLSFNDCPRAFADDHNKVNFAISYLKGIALAHFENSLIEPDLLNPPAWDDDYGEFISELKTYFESPDMVGKAESKLENLLMKPTQRITKYLVEFN